MKFLTNNFKIENLTTGYVVGKRDFFFAITARKAQLHKYSRSATIIVVQQDPIQVLVDLFAIWSLGMSAACLSPSVTKPELRNIVKFCKATAVITDHNYNYSEFRFCDVLDNTTSVDFNQPLPRSIDFPDLDG